MKNIGDIDKRLKVETKLDKDDIVFYNASNEPFSLYGMTKGSALYERMPKAIAQTVSEGVSMLSTNTAGIRLRFSTNSAYIAIKAKIPPFSIMSHMPPLGQAGFDLYVDDNEKSKFVGSFMPPCVNTENMDSFESVIDFSENKLHSFTINFPLYNGVNELLIGLQENAKIECGAQYSEMPPIVYYGSSITQGGCASRPGNAYQSIIARKNNIDFINLGFSGSAKGEPEIVDFLSDLTMSAFVCDYDYNSPTVETLTQTHSRLYHAIRNKNPNLPIILVTKPNFESTNIDDILRRDVIYKTYIDGINSNDKNLYFVDGESLFDDENRDCSTVDGCHPNDFGFVNMALVIGSALKTALFNCNLV